MITSCRDIHLCIYFSKQKRRELDEGEQHVGMKRGVKIGTPWRAPWQYSEKRFPVFFSSFFFSLCVCVFLWCFFPFCFSPYRETLEVFLLYRHTYM